MASVIERGIQGFLYLWGSKENGEKVKRHYLSITHGIRIEKYWSCPSISINFLKKINKCLLSSHYISNTAILGDAKVNMISFYIEMLIV